MADIYTNTKVVSRTEQVAISHIHGETPEWPIRPTLCDSLDLYYDYQ